MPSTRASVSYKKKDGHLTLSDDQKYLFWTPSTPANASPAVTIPIAEITNLQQTPANSEKVALRVIVKDENYVFSFTSPAEARKEQEAVTEALRGVIAAGKASAAQQLKATSNGADGGESAGQSAAMAIAKALSSRSTDEAWYDDNKLRNDFQLQRSLLQANKPLYDRFNQALKDKPESVSVAQFTTQFWSTRLHLLRAHAIEKAQKEGEYNVLPEIKYNTVIGPDGEPIKTLNMTKEQVALIFKQYPVVRKAFNETVPKPFADARRFWSAFFASRLLKKLKGLRIEKNDPQDPVLDRYLEHEEDTGPASIAGHVPHIIDLEGNEQNTHFHLEGDYEMRAAKHDRPILHILNSMSEKLLSHVAPADGEAHAPIGMDEGTFEQLRLRDLAVQDSDNRVVLNVREQARYTGKQDEDEWSADAKLYAQQDPEVVIEDIRAQLQPANDNGVLRLDEAIGFQSDEDDDEEEMEDGATTANGAKPAQVASHKSLDTASRSILSSISQRRSQTSNPTSPESLLSGLSQPLFDTLTITHNTTTEFLHYFWTLFLSGDSSRTAELQQLVATLDRSLDRINAVAEQAEEERKARVEKMREYQKKTGKRFRFDEAGLGGGKKVVEEMVRPTVEALKRAGAVYRTAFEEQSREAGAG
ncbi:hypothetical protein BAUCODRAFT_411193 [Baudoinia panamericana UAMH 10762]|uniref:BSD domain-containing protein n=1 Tax=Baudoinia panamericana (strain UAMH 10762) TaxID=717646 RepID=M2NGD5_BAUPA|nr:uncharacterized protein BAUCODRAFT_411193 [Baudoinia panamericana UAMH 10762]EMC98040.1 hypothetical protein BAUCODRAFT_411193 [Baudoinia panamericana UAMH 10762]